MTFALNVSVCNGSGKLTLYYSVTYLSGVFMADKLRKTDVKIDVRYLTEYFEALGTKQSAFLFSSYLEGLVRWPQTLFAEAADRISVRFIAPGPARARKHCPSIFLRGMWIHFRWRARASWLTVIIRRCPLLQFTAWNEMWKNFKWWIVILKETTVMSFWVTLLGFAWNTNQTRYRCANPLLCVNWLKTPWPCSQGVENRGAAVGTTASCQKVPCPIIFT